MMLRLSLPLILLSHSAYSMLLGWVESPGYPSGYSPHSSLNWSRCAPKGHTLSIRLIHLDLEDSHECENDAVKVYSNGNLISVLCGKREFEELQSTVNPLLLSSPGGCLSLHFYSDFSNTKRHTGFRGFYTVQDFDECEDDPENGCTQFCHNFIGGYHCSCRHGYYLDTDKHTCTVSCSKDLSGLNRGDISSPSWPGSYAENANCEYNLSVAPYLQLELHFSGVFDVEQGHDGQCIDALRVETRTGTLGPFCGITAPPSPLLTYSHNVKIRFTTDGYGTNKGFFFHFKTTALLFTSTLTRSSDDHRLINRLVDSVYTFPGFVFVATSMSVPHLHLEMAQVQSAHQICLNTLAHTCVSCHHCHELARPRLHVSAVSSSHNVAKGRVITIILEEYFTETTLCAVM
ncbi:complement C1s subcomponent-like protein [Lates japonicus]|uniref:Complement C1s subcomponent-like protein n=1 Tax=Lates japonicus TaxID=270547 RepID=A0AAD3MXX2_LATJO|nr:complement C1s subcomponent-like protein [Lates japonicus]